MTLDPTRLADAIYQGITSTSGAGLTDPTGNWKKIAKAIAFSVVEEVTTYAEVTVPPGSIIPGTVAVGAGPATAPNIVPIPIEQPSVPPGGVK